MTNMQYTKFRKFEKTRKILDVNLFATNTEHIGAATGVLKQLNYTIRYLIILDDYAQYMKFQNHLNNQIMNHLTIKLRL